jgi:hypothetical protein
MTKNNSLIWILAITVFILGAIRLLILMNPLSIDDSFVYYTYAQNIIEGRPFAYDIRNIPSEGFTSLLYLLLLTPFEFFKVNMSFASMLINLSAIFITVGAISHLTVITGLFKKNTMLVFASGLWVFIVNDLNIVMNLNLGLETMLGPMIVVLAGWAVWGTSSPNVIYQKRSLNAFFIILFLSYLIRPESMIFIAIVGIPLLVNKSVPLSLVIRKTFFFGVIFIAYHLLKLAIFDDIFPTGFYRKVGSGSGIEYVLQWAVDYSFCILPFILILFATPIMLIRRKQGILFEKRWLWFFWGVIMGILVFFTRTEPIVGYGYRFLMIPTFLTYISFLILMILFIVSIINRLKQIIVIQSFFNYVHYMILGGLIVLSANNMHPLKDDGDLLEEINIYHKALVATENQTYIKFGNHLNEHLDSPETATLVFGDAGALPYAFEGRFIDFNGLVEPYIARLFSMPDGQEKTQLFTDYILSQNPDIIFLGWRATNNGRWALPINSNSPFKGNLPIELFQSLHDYGIRYSCSLKSDYYDIHIGIWLDSPQYDSLVEATFSFCAIHGYVLLDGITAIGEGIEVKFEGISPVGDTTENDA